MANKRPEHLRRKRATAHSMAAAQRDISVSEFFAKNRHLLGFDNPRKALLTAVKEAVDNSLDACEEAGILPEMWVHIEQTGENRYKIGVQDNGPGIVKKQIPLIFGKLLYGSKFHRLRMSRGQQGIGISAAGMYGVLTTGKPVKIISKISKKAPAHYYEIQINTKNNKPEILNGHGEGVDIPAGEKGKAYIEKHGIEWVAVHDGDKEVAHGTRVTIELEGAYKRGRGSVEEYLEQTAIANPHVRLHYKDPENNERLFERSTNHLPPEPKEIKPHPYGVELGRLITMMKDVAGGHHFAISDAKFFPRQLRRRPKNLRNGQAEHPGQRAPHWPARSRRAVSGHSADENLVAVDRLHFAHRRRIVAERLASGRARRVLRRRHAAAVGVPR